MDLTQERGKSHYQRERRRHEQGRDDPIQGDVQQRPGKERGDHHAKRQGRKRAGRDRNADDPSPSLQHLELHGLLADGPIGQRPATIDDSREASHHHVEHACDAGQQEHGRQGELDRSRHVAGGFGVDAHVGLQGSAATSGVKSAVGNLATTLVGGAPGPLTAEDVVTFLLEHEQSIRRLREAVRAVLAT